MFDLICDSTFDIILEDLESRMPVMIQQFKKHYPDSTEKEATAVISRLNLFDPTRKKATYTPWILGLYFSHSVPTREDLLDGIERFDQLNQLKPLHHIQQLVSFPP